jgi:hypothetical protein
VLQGTAQLRKHPVLIYHFPGYVSQETNMKNNFRAAGRNLVNYRSRNRPETHALPA